MNVKMKTLLATTLLSCGVYASDSDLCLNQSEIRFDSLAVTMTDHTIPSPPWANSDDESPKITTDADSHSSDSEEIASELRTTLQRLAETHEKHEAQRGKNKQLRQENGLLQQQVELLRQDLEQLQGCMSHQQLNFSEECESIVRLVKESDNTALTVSFALQELADSRMKVGAAVDGLTAYIHERVKSSEVEETVSLEEQLREATSDLTAQLDEVKSELARRIAMAEEELIRVPGAKKKSKTQRQSNKIRELRATLKSREDDIYWLKERRETETSELRAQLEEEASERRTQLNEMKSELERKSEEICRLRRQYDEDTEVLRVLLESETSTLRAQLERTTSEIRALQDEMKPNPEHRERTHMRIVNRKLKDQLLEMESTIKRKEEDVEYTRNQYKLQLEYKRQEVTKLVARLERQMKITSELNAKLARQSPETE
ncbi:MAG: hypothetical protein LBT03_01290 [Holosporales bacterium]|nr:hypothetical protein [Holosporales bacterium]